MYSNLKELPDGVIEIKADLYDVINDVAKKAGNIEDAANRLLQVYIQDGILYIQLKKES
ncbi:hypothetical protein [Paenibacillus oralis]|uniref:hypothetical protein n=1 Tax=Paenibacillus oralis TaxID=2490856 RepID=UPI0015ACB3D7|nr:hypothetical protein [Paenibacillus oralis]